MDYLNRNYRYIKLNDAIDSIRNIKGYFVLQKGYGDFYNYFIDQNGNIIFDELKKSNFIFQLKPINHSSFSYFFVVQNGKEYLDDADG
jgi:hypothetical protein